MPVTPLSFLRLMMAVSRAAAARLEISPAPPATPPPHLLHQLEILVCDSSTLKYVLYLINSLEYNLIN